MIVGTDRFEILGDNGKIVVENSKTATVTRLSRPEREISDEMSADDVRRVLTGQLDKGDFSTAEVIEFDSGGGSQHAGVLQNFAANILDGTPLSHRARRRRHQRGTTGQCDPPLQLDRQ